MENWVIGKIPLEREDSEVTIRITSLLIPTPDYIGNLRHSIIPCLPASPERLAMAGRCGREAQVSIKSLYPFFVWQELPFSGSDYTEFGLVCQTKINLMMLWGQIHVWKCGMSAVRARMVWQWIRSLTLPENRKMAEIWVRLSHKPIAFF